MLKSLLKPIVKVVEDVVETTVEVVEAVLDSPLDGLRLAIDEVAAVLTSVVGHVVGAAHGIASWLVHLVGGTVNALYPILGALILIIGVIMEEAGFDPPSLPLPNPIVTVDTRSGDVERRTYVPMGGEPHAIDVDDGGLFGVLKPDIAVAINLVSLEEFPARPIVPRITVWRHQAAVMARHPAPPLWIDHKVQIHDALSSSFEEIATVHYGYETPEGALVPPKVDAKILGEIQSGFVEPLDAVIEAPGHQADLDFHVDVSTPELGANIGLQFAPMPERLRFTQVSRDDGLDIHYEHNSVDPVNLDAQVRLDDKVEGGRLDVETEVDRLPSEIDVEVTTRPELTLVRYTSDFGGRKPDIGARLVNRDGDGTELDARVDIVGLPPRMEARVDSLPDDEGGAEIDRVDFRVLPPEIDDEGEEGEEEPELPEGWEQIDSADFEVKNYIGDPGPVPEPLFTPEQNVTVHGRVTDEGLSRFRAAGRIEEIRSATTERSASGTGYVIRTDVGDGEKPLRALLDLDERGTGAPADAGRFRVDAALRPLPAQIETTFEPDGQDGDTEISYRASSTLDATADLYLVEGPGTECGDAHTVCVDSGIDRVPASLDLRLPGEGGTDYAVSHDAPDGEEPEVRATVDITPEEVSERIWADMELLTVPQEVRARVDVAPDGALRAAQFHACDFDFGAPFDFDNDACRDDQRALERVTFTVRDHPDRSGLPDVPPVADGHVALLRRDSRFEASGRVSEIRNVAFRQNGQPGDPGAAIGVLVDAGEGDPFDVVVDQVAPDEAYKGADPQPAAHDQVEAGVSRLPERFAACFRQDADAPPGPGSSDSLLASCDRAEGVGRPAGTLPQTPLSVNYRASSPTRVDAKVQSRAQDPEDGDREHLDRLQVSVDEVPDELAADFLPGRDSSESQDGIPIEVAYRASDAIDRIDFEIRQGRADGSVHDGSLYARAEVEGIPGDLAALVASDDGFVERAEFHPCAFDFAAVACEDEAERGVLDSVDFLVRHGERRGPLPPRPKEMEESGESGVALVARGDRFEVSGRVTDVTQVALRQHEEGEGDETDLSLGALVGAGSGGPFRVFVDEEDAAGEEATGLDARVHDLPDDLRVCVRAPTAAEATAGDALFELCEGRLAPDAAPDSPLPLAVGYAASAPTVVDAVLATREWVEPDEDADPSAVPELVARDVDMSIDAVPAELRADLVIPEDGDSGEPLAIDYRASSAIDGLDVTLHERPADESFDSDGTYAEIRTTAIPTDLSARVSAGGEGTGSAEVHACRYDYSEEECTTPLDEIGSVEAVVRPDRRRGQLPPRPSGLATGHAVVLDRGEFSEILAAASQVRTLVLRSSPAPSDGEEAEDIDETIGVLVRAGSGQRFDVLVDSEPSADEEKLRLASTVHSLPQEIRACFRPDDEERGPVVSGDELLRPCEEREAPDGSGITPLSVVYEASQPTVVEADLRKTTPAEGDDPGGRELLKLKVDELPARLSADVVPDSEEDERPLLVRYDASAEIGEIEFELEDRIGESLCIDPRPGAEATCVSGRLTNLSQRLDLEHASTAEGERIEVSSSPPASGSPRPALRDLVLRTTKPGDGSSSDVLRMSGDVVGLTPRLVARILEAEDAEGEPVDPAAIVFNACPDGPCPGIGEISFDVTNALIDDDVASDFVPTPPPGVTQSFTLVQRGDAFRATGEVRDFREIGMTYLDDEGDLTETMRMRAGFGSGADGERLHAVVDTADGRGSRMLLDTVIDDPPTGIELCLREPVDPGGHDAGSAVWCEAQDHDRLAVQAKLDQPASGNRPTIDVRQFESRSPGSFLAGQVRLEDLGERVDVLVGDGDEPDILVEGRTLDGDPADVVGRVTFDIRDIATAPVSFPFGPRDERHRSRGRLFTDPSSDPRTQEPAGLDVPNRGRNYITVGTSPDAMRVRGSIPQIRSVGITPRVCDPSDERFPDPAEFPPAQRPDYSCVRAQVAAERRLGVAVRTLDEDGEILALEEGFIDRIPSGGLHATITSQPGAVDADPVCEDADSVPCRVPMLSVEAPRGGGVRPTLDGVLLVGDDTLVGRAVDQLPRDPLTRNRLDFDQAPADFEARGARVKVISVDDEEGESQVALRVGLSIQIPRFLDLDPITMRTCERVGSSGCEAENVEPKENRGSEATDLFIKLVGAESARLGTDGPNLGRVALLVDPLDQAENQIVLTGTPAANADGGTSTFNPESLPGPGAHDLGALIPGHLDARVYLRDDYTAPTDRHFQQKFVQVDGRVNAPLSLALRLNEAESGRARSGSQVPMTQFTIREAPGATPSGGYDRPTFRVRAEVRSPREEGPKWYECQGDGLGIDFRFFGFGVSACLITPNPTVQYLDVQLNHKPTSAAAARTVEALVDLDGGENNVDLVGFQDVRRPAEGKGPNAGFAPQAHLRMTDFDLGARLGAGIGIIGGKIDLLLSGDLIVGVRGLGTQRTRLGQNLGAIALRSAGGTSRINTNLHEAVRLKVYAEALFGLVSKKIVDVSTPAVRIPLAFRNCSTGGLFGGGFSDQLTSTNTTQNAGITFGLSSFPSSLIVTGNPLALILDLLPPIFCAIGAESGNMVTADSPSTRVFPDMPVEDTPVSGTTERDPRPAPQDPEPPNITVSGGTRTECGTLVANNLTVTSTGRLRAGAPGETVTIPNPDPDGDDLEIACDGSLRIQARTVTVNAGGRIDSDARITSAGPGTPTAGLGGGGGNAGAGGRPDGAPASHSGPQVPLPSDGVLAAFGSPGRNGTGGVQAGAGGGVIGISASERITVNGRVSAVGGAGAGAGANDCDTTAAGGGSGGAVALEANVVRVGGSGLVSAAGGNGGASGRSGGGGGGGRVSVDSIVEDVDGTKTASGGSAGSTNQDCAASAGGNGNANHGQQIGFAGTVEFEGETRNGFVQGDGDLRIRGVDGNADRLDVIVCRRSLPISAADPFEGDDLDPQGTTAAQLVSTGTCVRERFNGPTESDGVSYERTRSIASMFGTMADGYHGFYAFAARPPVEGSTGFPFDPPVPYPPCITIFGSFNSQCAAQDPLPEASPVKVSSDRTNPGPLTAIERDGIGDCAGVGCLTERIGHAEIDADDNFSGVDTIECRAGAGNPWVACGPGGFVPVNLRGDGLRSVDIRVRDVAGNLATFTDQLTWFVDERNPNRPTVNVSFSEPATNGWQQAAPDVTVSVTDPGPSSGFDTDAVTIEITNMVGLETEVDEHRCGSASSAAGSGSRSTSCSAADIAPFLPTEGEYSIRAWATDRAGRTSEPSTAINVKVDHTPPLSRLFLAPEEPDGNSGWYRTRPFLAFAATDGPAGSGIDPSGNTPPSEIRYRVGTSGSFQTWDPSDPPRLPDGTHTVCWYAIDLAGNREANGAPALASPNCRQNIRVDGARPEPEESLTPADPDGDNDWYLSGPDLEVEPNEPASGSGIGAVGSSGTFFSVDAGPFERLTGQATLPDDTREVCFYAEDRAGNLGGGDRAGVAGCRDVQVDAEPPAAPQIDTEPARPDGENGWFTVEPRLDLAAIDDRFGSGVSPFGDPPPTGIRFTVDGGATQTWDPDDVEQTRLGDGVHEVCARAVDAAGNEGPETCREVKVDTQAPTATATVNPPFPDGANGWHVGVRPEADAAGADVGPSGLDRLELRLNNGVWREAEPTEIPDGVHRVEVRAVDTAGNVSPVDSRIVKADLVDPDALAVTFPEDPNGFDWYRRLPRMSVATLDRESGPDGSTYEIIGPNGAPAQEYASPFTVPEGLHTTRILPRDVAGRVGGPVDVETRVDVTPPVPRPVGQPTTILLPTDTNTLEFEVDDALSDRVLVRVVILDQFGNKIRVIQADGDDDGYRPTGPGHVTWNGLDFRRKASLPGIYHFRVVAIDEAGNSAASGESRTFPVVWSDM